MSQVIPSTSPRIVTKKVKKVSKDDELLNMAIAEMKKSDDEQIFGDFVASSIRNLRCDISKRKLKRKIQAAILEITDYDEELINPNRDPKPSTSFPNNFSNLSSASSNLQDSVNLLDISASRCSSEISNYYDNFDETNI